MRNDPVAPRAALFVAMVFPTLMAWGYFVALAGEGGRPNPGLQVGYSLGKLVQFAFPLLCMRAVAGHWPHWPAPTMRGLAAGAVLGAVIGTMIVIFYYGA